MPDNSAPSMLGGYPYAPQALLPRDAALSMAERFHVMLMDGGMAKVQAEIAAEPGLLAELLPVVGNPEASINVRLGASVIFERHAGEPALRALVPRLAQLSEHEDARVRADACFYLGLAGEMQAKQWLLPRLKDESADVREIAADAIEMLGD